MIVACTYLSINLFTATKIVSFQEDGHFDSTSFLNSTNGIGGMDLTDFTVCVRINLNMLRGREQFFLSYVNAEFDETLTGTII